jgi:hypothetical protein
MNPPQDTTIAPVGASSRWMRSPRTWKLPWFTLFRWGFGVFGPILCFGLAVTRLEDLIPMLGPRSGVLVFAAVCIAAQLISNLRPARGDLLSAGLAGVLRAACVVGTLYSVMLTPLAAVFLVVVPPVGVIGLLPLAATMLYFRSAEMERRSADHLVPRPCKIALFCGFLLPSSMSWSALKVARSFESRVVASYVDTELPSDLSRLERFRPIAWLHDWPDLKHLYRDSFVSGAVDPSEGERAGQAWSALTGRPAEALGAPLD